MLSTINHQPSTNRDRRAIIFWLSLCALLVSAMVVIGGYTRLSGSGLSITEWKPIHGALPPLNEAEWQEEFAAYQQSPQYQKVNRGMSLDEFKIIFWPEFFHRLLGRIIGAVFFIPLVVFAMRKSFSTRFGWRLLGIFALGGLQGLIGWLMVKSGLVNDPHVSYLRLALHLAVAFAILGMLVWAILDVVTSYELRIKSTNLLATRNSQLVTYLLWFTLLCLQIILGSFMAGLHGGLIYNTWPGMDTSGVWSEKIATVQFLHRRLAELLAGGFLFWWYLCRAYVKNKHLGKGCAVVTVILAMQFALGVVTLLHQAPLVLALAHQAVALLLFVASVILLYKQCHPRA